MQSQNNICTYFFIVAKQSFLFCVQTSKSLEVIFAQNFQTGPPDLSLSALLREEGASGSQKSLFATLRALLLAPNSAGFEMSGGNEDALMQDESGNIGDRRSNRENPHKSKGCSDLLKTICSTLDSAMAHIVAAYKQANSSTSENLAAQSKLENIEDRSCKFDVPFFLLSIFLFWLLSHFLQLTVRIDFFV